MSAPGRSVRGTRKRRRKREVQRPVLEASGGLVSPWDTRLRRCAKRPRLACFAWVPHPYRMRFYRRPH